MLRKEEKNMGNIEIKTREEKKQREKAYYEEAPQIGGRRPSRIRQQINRGMTVFVIVAACILFYFALLRLGHISDVIFKIIDVLKPVLYGCVIAYLLNPIVKRVDAFLIPKLQERMKKPENAEKVSRSVGIFVSLIILIVLITVLLNMLIPELYSSIRNMVLTLPKQVNDALDKINSIQLEDSTTVAILKNALEEGTTMLTNWLRTDLMTQVNSLMSNLTVGIFNVISEVFNMLIGVIVSVYILYSKEIFARQCKKAVYALFRADRANMVLHITTKSNEIFGGFVIGKILDSAIIGLLCFIGLTILNMPYTMLVSVIVGVTNVIPFFGPYIGAIPSTILICIGRSNERNLFSDIYSGFTTVGRKYYRDRRFLGNSTGLSAFWVVFSILLGGGLFGFVGMVMGVPTFAVIYYIVDMILDNKLKKKKLPVRSDSYDEWSYVDSSGEYIHSEEIKSKAEEK